MKRTLPAPFLALSWLLFLALILPPPVEAGQANLFVYHRFGDDRYPSTNIPTSVFAGQLEYLHDNGFTVLPLGEVARRLKAQEPLPERCVCLTVDDAYSSFATGAMPLLRRFGYPVTLFVSTDLVGHPGYLSWDELRGLAAEGVEIGNHSAGHGHLVKGGNGEGLEQAVADIARAQLRFAEELGSAPELFAYPFGEFTPELVEMVEKMGFVGAVAQHSGVVHGESERFALPRFPMGGPYATLEGFRRKVSMGPLPVLDADPRDPVIGEQNPPVLLVRIESGEVDLSRLSFFVQGSRVEGISALEGRPGWFVVQGAVPLNQRRSKYTLTAPASDGKGWYWYSHLWIRPELPE